MFCPKCGFNNPEQIKFCGSCGYALQEINEGKQDNVSPIRQKVMLMVTHSFSILVSLLLVFVLFGKLSVLRVNLNQLQPSLPANRVNISNNIIDYAEASIR